MISVVEETVYILPYFMNGAIKVPARETKFLEDPQRKINGSFVNRIDSPDAIW